MLPGILGQAEDMHDSSQYTGEGYTDLGVIVASFGRLVELTDSELTLQSMTHTLASVESRQVLFDASAIPTQRMAYRTTEMGMYGNLK